MFNLQKTFELSIIIIFEESYNMQIKYAFHYVEIVFLNSESHLQLKKIVLNLHPICA
jgi:hypothetical protein